MESKDLVNHSARPDPGAPFPPRSSRITIIAIFALALAIRLVVAFAFWGSIDVTLQIYHGQRINSGQSSWTSKLPVAYMLPAWMQWLSRATPTPENVAQKLPAILGDMLTALLLWRLAARSRRPWLWPAVYLLNPVTIILSAYNGNVDPIMAAAMLWALILRWKGRPVTSGFALGLSILMKPTALLALPPLAFPLTWRGVRFGAAALLTVAAICAPFILIDPSFGRFLARYGGAYGEWGLPLILREIGHAIDLQAANLWVEQFGRYVMVALFAVWFVYMMKRWRLASLTDNASAIAATWLFFYVIATGWGAQYLSLALPFLLIVSVRLTVIYSVAATPYLLATYLYAEKFAKYAGQSFFGRLDSLPAADLAILIANRSFAVLAWAACVYILWRLCSDEVSEPQPVFAALPASVR
jgi:4-amino-4-deoxy-L-arabinose transferase-like glycosyltransferase